MSTRESIKTDHMRFLEVLRQGALSPPHELSAYQHRWWILGYDAAVDAVVATLFVSLAEIDRDEGPESDEPTLVDFELPAWIHDDC